MMHIFRAAWKALLLIIMVLALSRTHSVSPCSAADVQSILKEMKEVVEPVRPSIQKMVITKTERGASQQIVLLQAFKKLTDGKRRLIIEQKPAELKGATLLIRESAGGKQDIMWVYLPAFNRVRELLGVDQYDSFLGTTFTYADMGFVKLQGKYALLGEETCEGKQAYKVEEKRLPDNYYSRIINWITVDSKIPLKRDYYSAGSQLWKTEIFKDVTVIDGTPTAIRTLMTLVDGRTSTELKITEINYDVNIPDELFDPNRLSTAAMDPIWKSFTPRPVGKH